MSGRRIGTIAVIAAAIASAQVCAAPSLFSGIGGNNTSVTPGTANAAMAAFLAAIGGADNGNSTAVHASGYRKINWDGVPEAQATPNLLPADYYNGTQPRGVMLLTPGTGVAVSATTTMAVLNFGNINAIYESNFGEFSPLRLFAPSESNIVQVYFYQPGTNLPAMVRGFGAIFNDVELSNTTSIRYFGFDGSDLNNPPGSFHVAVGSGGQSEFLGVLFAPTDPPIGHVVITLGNAALGAGTNESGLIDLVVMDDIVYAEPRADLIFADGFE